MTALEALVSRLVTQGVAIENETIYAGSASDLPDIGTGFLSIIETGGFAPLWMHNSDPLPRPSFQITAHASEYPVASDLIRAAYDVVTFTNLLVGDVFFLYSNPIQSPFSLGNDANGLVRMSFNINTLHR